MTISPTARGERAPEAALPQPRCPVSGREEKREKGIALVALAANFGKDLPKPLFKLWLDLLAPYPSLLVEEAVRNVIQGYEYKTLPPFAVLQRELDALRGVGARGHDLRATDEWGALMTEMARRGSYSPPERLHPTTLHVLRLMGGWHAACAWTEDSLDFKRRAFIAHWTECHGKVQAMEPGSAGLRPVIGTRREGAGRIGGKIRNPLAAGSTETRSGKTGEGAK